MKIIALTTLLALPSYAVLAVPDSCASPDDWSLQKWDAIVVGAGTAGIIVADKLSEAGKKTLLLEIGGPSYGITGGLEKPEWLNGSGLSRVDVPGLYKSIFSGDTGLTCDANLVNAFQGCTIGGTSAINAGLYFQPPASDWDLYHPEGWKSADVQAATDRLLHRQPSVMTYSRNDQFYLQSGYEAAKEWIVDGAGFADVSINDNPNNKVRAFGRPVYNYIDGQRGGPVRTYLQTAMRRPNFHLQTEARVLSIIQDRGIATGLVVRTGKGRRTVELASNGRIILSAGALVSPQLLMVSGIGPQDVLSNLTTTSSFITFNSSSWVVNSAVGEGLFDNPNTFIELSGPTIQSYTHSYTDPIPGDRDLYLSFRSGPYSFASQTAVIFGTAIWEGHRFGVQGTIDSSGFGDYTANNTITLNLYGTSGLFSSGRVMLSSDHDDYENFTSSPSSGIYYADPRDGWGIAAFISEIFESLPQSTPESPAQDGLTPLNIPRNSTMEDIYNYITTPSKYAVGAVQHWSSSCRIGTCVDADTKVIGTTNIHVVDASIISPLSVNPQFGVMVAAEKGAERVLATWH